jgi:hypothetical protein
MRIGFAANWLLVRIGQPVSTGPGGRLAVIRRLRLAPIGFWLLAWYGMHGLPRNSPCDQPAA